MLIEAADEIDRLRDIIARNALQRLRGEDATELYVTADDIKDSLEVLYAWQASKSPNDPSSATRPTRASDCNQSARAGFAAAHG
jgi:hypothetical protein